MPFWAAFGVSLAAFFVFLASSLREEGETSSPWFRVIYCHAFTFCALTILLFEVSDTVFVACATSAFVLSLFFAGKTDLHVPWLHRRTVPLKVK